MVPRQYVAGNSEAPAPRRTAGEEGVCEICISRDADRADILDTLFGQSLVHLSRYRSSEPFHRGRRDWFASYVTRPGKFARCLVANLAPGPGRPELLEIAEDPGNQYRVVDYEVSPLRTTGGKVFEDGTPGRSSGGGGIDLLLATEDGTPVIVEIKARGDGSLFSALVLMAKEDGAIASHVRRISIAEASLEDAGPPRFRLHHMEESVRWSPAHEE